MNWREELYHHGVKGMRWGVRKDRANSSASNRGTPRNATNEVESLDKYKRTTYGDDDWYERKVKAANGKEYGIMFFIGKKDPPDMAERKLKTVEECKKRANEIDETAWPMVNADYLKFASEWTGRNVSEKEFRKKCKLESFYVYDGGVELTYYDGGEFFYGHVINIDYDLKTKKPLNSALNG